MKNVACTEQICSDGKDDDGDGKVDCVDPDCAARNPCGFERCAVTVGERADLVLLEAETLAEAVVAQPPRRLVVSHGRVVARDGALIS